MGSLHILFPENWDYRNILKYCSGKFCIFLLLKLWNTLLKKLSLTIHQWDLFLFLTHCHLEGAHQSTFLDTGGFRPSGWKGEILHRWPLKNIDLFSNHNKNNNKTIHFQKEEEESFSILQFILKYFTTDNSYHRIYEMKDNFEKKFFGKFSIHGKKTIIFYASQSPHVSEWNKGNLFCFSMLKTVWRNVN